MAMVCIILNEREYLHGAANEVCDDSPMLKATGMCYTEVSLCRRTSLLMNIIKNSTWAVPF